MGLFDRFKKKPSAPAASPKPPLSREDREKYEQVLADVFHNAPFPDLETESARYTKKIKERLGNNNEFLFPYDASLLSRIKPELVSYQANGRVNLNIKEARKLLGEIEQGKFLLPTAELNVLVATDQVEHAKKILGTVFAAEPTVLSEPDEPLMSVDGTARQRTKSQSIQLTYKITQQELNDLRGKIAGNHVHLPPNDPDLAPFIYVTLDSKLSDVDGFKKEAYSWQHPAANLAEALDLTRKPHTSTPRQLPPGDDPKRAR